jgi:hypothetical protein
MNGHISLCISGKEMILFHMFFFLVPFLVEKKGVGWGMNPYFVPVSIKSFPS